ncbi:MAG: serine--tRNA ligase [Simkaniaceae bacterium]|nr:serine--tRNA ligase [Simkaniaceae bacterium]
MLDIKKLKEEQEKLEPKLKAKDPTVDLSELLSKYESFCGAKKTFEERQSELNAESKRIGELKRKGEDATAVMQRVAELKKGLDLQAVKESEAAYLDLLARIPNVPMPHIKESLDPKDNELMKTHGEKPTFDFTIKNHLELSELHQLIDFKRGAKTSGSGFHFYTNLGARIEWALLQLMIDTHLKNGFEMILPPHLVRPEAMYGCGQLPKFESQTFQLHDKDFDLYLIPTAEAALNAFHMEEIIPEEELPKKYVSYSPCFRREAGAHGAEERGLIRVHQFNKVELFCFAHPEKSEEIFEEMLASAEEVLQKLELHYRNMLLVTGDMSFPAAKTVDIEVYLPGQERYYEVSSVSNCTDYQARRSRTRTRIDGKPTPLHTLNGSGLATARLLVALLENNQQADGSIRIPSALSPYLGGLTHVPAPN